VSETFFVGLARAHPIPSVFDMRTRLSIAEQIAIAFFVYLTLAAFVLHLDAHDLCIIMALNGDPRHFDNAPPKPAAGPLACCRR